MKQVTIQQSAVVHTHIPHNAFDKQALRHKQIAQNGKNTNTQAKQATSNTLIHLAFFRRMSPAPLIRIRGTIQIAGVKLAPRKLPFLLMWLQARIQRGLDQLPFSAVSPLSTFSLAPRHYERREDTSSCAML